jgi:hypothetical protein
MERRSLLLPWLTWASNVNTFVPNIRSKPNTIAKETQKMNLACYILTLRQDFLAHIGG